MSEITFGRASHIELHYFVLAQLDLGRDAASLFPPPEASTHRKPPAWVAPLLETYRAHPTEAAALQFMPLTQPDLDALLATLAQADNPLYRRFSHALQAEAYAHSQRWQKDASAAQARSQAACRQLAPTLSLLRNALWQRLKQAPPALFVYDVPSLGPHARAASVAGARLCATSLAQDPNHSLCQIFHEETHPIADPLLDLATQPSRQTALHSPGYQTHARIERNAVELGASIIAQAAPHLHHAYQQWRKPFGI